MIIFGLDPGTTQSGWVLLEKGRVLDSGVHDNHDVLRWVQAGQDAQVLAVEMIASMGMAVGQTTFETVRWIGRFQQAWREPEAVRLVYRSQVKQHLCGTQRAQDTNVRQALIDMLGHPGTKGKPGPTYGVKSHAWSALAVAVTARAMLDSSSVFERPPEPEVEHDAFGAIPA